MRRHAGFTLLEVIIAMGILAIGATTSLALLVSATATGRHAEHLVDSSLIADSVMSDLEGELNGSFGPRKLERLDSTDSVAARSSVLGDGPIRAVPLEDPNTPVPDQAPPPAQTTPAPSPTPTPDQPTAPQKPPASTNGPPRAFTEDPFSAAKTYWWKKDAKLDAYPDYKFDVSLTPIGGPPDDPWEFLVEVTVRWTEKGQKRDGLYRTILLKKLTQLDNEPPPN